MRRPAFQFYVADWLKPGPVRAMSAEARGVYIDLLAYSWDNEGIGPEEIENPRMLANLCGMTTRKFRALWDQVRGRFGLSSGQRYVNFKQEEQREELKKFSDQQSQKARSRWDRDCHGITGQDAAGNALLLQSSSSPSSSGSDPRSSGSETDSGARAGTPLALFADSPPPRKQPSRGAKVDPFTPVAMEVLAAFNDARRRLNPKARAIDPRPSSLAEICGRLKEGYSAADCLHVIEVCEAQVRAGTMWGHFDTISPFRAANFPRRVGEPVPISLAAQPPRSEAAPAKEYRPSWLPKEFDE